ncbi:TolC family protein [Campylobacter concisus]|uniref:TolC family protein n=1 Tax=Campylobacter concisus TaxID=199 RepID=A0A7S9SBG8_9BACT|nr:TolC family protein [Campylobacter concisus]ERJ27486.1 Agglutination protein [Campylobacter concisus ATCC 51561]QPI07025.1 TolC family protein [Campylobacter concisus]
MKKMLAISALAAATLLSAQDVPYRIFLASFAQDDSAARIDSAVSKVNSKISDSRLTTGVYEVGGRKFLYVDTTPVSENEANELLAKVQNESGYKDALMRAKLPVANAQSAKKSNIEQTISAEPKAAVTAQADDSVLTLDQVVKTILNENPSLKATEFNYLQVGKDLKIAKNAYYPTLDAAARVGYERKRLDDGLTTRRGDGRVSGASLTLVENLYNGGADKNRINSQSARLDSAAYTVAQAADRLTLSAANAYLQVLQTKRILDIEEENVKSHEEIYSQIKDRARSGYGVASEERQAGSRYTLAQSNYIAAKNNYEDALSTFEKLYGRKVAAKNLVMPEFNLPLPSTKEAVYDKAVLCNPTLLVQRSNIAMAESVVKEKNAPFLPKLDLVVSGAYDHSNVLYDDYEEQTFDALLRLNYNLYNKGNDKLDKEKSQLAVQQEQQTMDNLVRELKESLEFSWQNYILNQEKMGYLNQHVEYAKATLDAYQDEFRIGRRDLINLLDAENEYNTALKEIATTETALSYAKYRLLDNMGMVSDSFEPGFAKRYIQGACSIQNDLR